ncbi:MAG: DUF3575 domain-containing protein [Bacteroidota bacterium]
MTRILGSFLLSLLFLSPAYSQGDIHIGLQLSPLLIRTVDLHVEQQLTSFFSWEGGLGFRQQTLQNGEPARFAFIENYIQPRNQSAFLRVGGRFYNQIDWDYPYIAVNLTGSYFSEEINPTQGTTGPTREVRGWQWGMSTTIGFVIRVSERWHLDLGMQMGYANPRPKDDVLAYYTPGLGYSSFGLGRIGVDGGHFQPVICLKYNVVQDKRKKIRDME